MKLTLPSILPIAALGLLAACAADDAVEGVRTGKDTNGLMLTSAAPAGVAQCISAALGSVARPEGSGFVIMPANGPPAAYHVRPFDDQLHRYVTIVEITGSTEPPAATVPSGCLHAEPGPGVKRK